MKWLFVWSSNEIRDKIKWYFYSSFEVKQNITDAQIDGTSIEISNAFKVIK